MASLLTRLLFLGCYILSALVLLSTLATGTRADEGMWALFGLAFGVTTLVALMVVFILPLSYCTPLKAIGLAGTGGLLVFVFGYGIEFLRDFYARMG